MQFHGNKCKYTMSLGGKNVTRFLFFNAITFIGIFLCTVTKQPHELLK